MLRHEPLRFLRPTETQRFAVSSPDDPYSWESPNDQSSRHEETVASSGLKYAVQLRWGLRSPSPSHIMHSPCPFGSVPPLCQGLRPDPFAFGCCRLYRQHPLLACGDPDLYGPLGASAHSAECIPLRASGALGAYSPPRGPGVRAKARPPLAGRSHARCARWRSRRFALHANRGLLCWYSSHAGGRVLRPFREWSLLRRLFVPNRTTRRAS